MQSDVLHQLAYSLGAYHRKEFYFSVVLGMLTRTDALWSSG